MEDNEGKDADKHDEESPAERTASSMRLPLRECEFTCRLGGSPTCVKVLAPDVIQIRNSFNETLKRIEDEKMRQCPGDKFEINLTMIPLIIWKYDVEATSISDDE